MASRNLFNHPLVLALLPSDIEKEFTFSVDQSEAVNLLIHRRKHGDVSYRFLCIDIYSLDCILSWKISRCIAREVKSPSRVAIGKQQLETAEVVILGALLKDDIA